MHIGDEKMLDVMREQEQRMLADLLVRFVKDGTISSADFLEGVHQHVDQLEDLRYSASCSVAHSCLSPSMCLTL